MGDRVRAGRFADIGDRDAGEFSLVVSQMSAGGLIHIDKSAGLQVI